MILMVKNTLSNHCLTIIKYLDRGTIQSTPEIDKYVHESIYSVIQGNRIPGGKNAHQPITIGGPLLEAANKTRHSHYHIKGEKVSYRWEIELEHLLDQVESRHMFKNGQKWRGNRLNYHGVFYKHKATPGTKKFTVAASFFISRDPDEEALFTIIKTEMMVPYRNKSKGRLKYEEFVNKIAKRIKRRNKRNNPRKIKCRN